MTYEELVRLALSFSDVEESVSYGMPSVKRKKKYLFGLQREAEEISITLDWESHDLFLLGYPEVCYKTPHYEGWPAFLVRLEKLESSLAEALVEASWRNAPKPSKRRVV